MSFNLPAIPAAKPKGIQLAYYGDTSLIITGETYNLRNNIKSLGGTWDKAAKGWKFARGINDVNLAPLAAFVEQVNNGSLNIQNSSTQQQQSYQTAAQYNNLVSKDSNSNAFTPDQAINMLQNNIGSVKSPTRLNIQPLSIKPSHPINLNIPNVFVAADGLQYQIIIQTVPLPVLNQKVVLQYLHLKTNYTITEVGNTYPFDMCVITEDFEENTKLTEATESTENTQTLEEFTPKVYTLKIINGQWQIDGMAEQHTIIFVSNLQD